MNLLKQLKDVLAEGKEQIYKASEVLAGKVKEVSDEGLEISKELFAEISERTNEIGDATRMKFEVRNLENELDTAFAKLGDLVCKTYAAKQRDRYQGQLDSSIQKILQHQQLIRKKTLAYESFRKKFSSKYLIHKLSDELENGEATIDQVVITKNSGAVNKKLRDIELPKEALISAIKRSDKIIIPDGNTKLLVGDILTIIGKKKDVTVLINFFKV